MKQEVAHSIVCVVICEVWDWAFNPLISSQYNVAPHPAYGEKEAAVLLEYV